MLITYTTPSPDELPGLDECGLCGAAVNHAAHEPHTRWHVRLLHAATTFVDVTEAHHGPQTEYTVPHDGTIEITDPQVLTRGPSAREKAGSCSQTVCIKEWGHRGPHMNRGGEWD